MSGSALERKHTLLPEMFVPSCSCFALPHTPQAPADIAMLDELEQDVLWSGEDGAAAAVQASSSSGDECSEDDQAE